MLDREIFVGHSTDRLHLIILGIKEQCGSQKREKRYFLEAHEVDEIIEKLTQAKKELEELKRGICTHCKHNIYVGDACLKLPNGELIHKYCLVEFMQTDNCIIINSPLKEVTV